MPSMADEDVAVTGGVDTHGDFHQAAVIDAIGRELGTESFPATTRGYRELLAWVRGHGRLACVGVEGTGSYGKGLARFLAAQAVAVVEVNRPDRAARRSRGKSDPVDAYAAARAALSGQASAVPKTGDGLVESIRVLKRARDSGVKQRTAVINQVKSMIVTAPDELRGRLSGLTRARLRDAAAALRPDPDIADVTAATKTALRHLARRWQQLDEQIDELEQDLFTLTACENAELLARPGVGPDVAAQLLITAGDNPDRLRSSAAFAALCGVSPIEASSGKIRRHRLNRGGDRAANAALHRIVVTRLRIDPKTRAFAARRSAEQMSNKEIMRCLKRYVAREVYQLLTAHLPPRTLVPHGTRHAA